MAKTKKEIKEQTESDRNFFANKLALADDIPTFVNMKERSEVIIEGSRMNWLGVFNYYAKPLDNCDFGIIQNGKKIYLNNGDNNLIVKIIGEVNNNSTNYFARIIKNGKVVKKLSTVCSKEALWDKLLDYLK